MLRLNSSTIYIFEELYSERALGALIDAAPRHKRIVTKLDGDEHGNYLGVVGASIGAGLELVALRGFEPLFEP